MTTLEWVRNYCRTEGIDWSALTPGQRFQVTRLIPCSIRCFRVGEPVEVGPGQTCPECGKPEPQVISWALIPLEV